MGRRAIKRAFSIERRLEKTRSWKRCSVGSSNRSARKRSLESGVTLWRLNHELLPEPGSPIARTTTPLEGRCGASTGVVAEVAATAVRPCGGGAVDTALSFGAGCTDLPTSLPVAADSAVEAPLRLRP